MRDDGEEGDRRGRRRSLRGDRLRPLLRRHRRDAPAGVQATALGVVVVTPPWNFPFAIPCGGVLAALMAGNAVILKPAPETVRIGLAARASSFGRPACRATCLQFVPCADGDTGPRAHHRSAHGAVVLTGALGDGADVPKLATVAAAASRRRAGRTRSSSARSRIAIWRSRISCAPPSATPDRSAPPRASAILEAEVYDDPVFRRQLRDAAASLHVGPSTDPASVVTPLIREAGADLHRALTTLEPGEEWLLEPRQDSADPCLWSPGIRLGVQPGSWFHQTECFGPVLGLMRARDLDEAIELPERDVAYGLTAGLHSLDEDEIAAWRERVEAGNLYINRAITGAIVQRQPFGGWKRSCHRAGREGRRAELREPFPAVRRRRAARRVERAAESYRAAWAEHFSQGARSDRAALREQCLPLPPVPRRRAASPSPTPRSRHSPVSRREICGVPLEISRATEETDAAFAARLPHWRSALNFSAPSTASRRASCRPPTKRVSTGSTPRLAPSAASNSPAGCASKP